MSDPFPRSLSELDRYARAMLNHAGEPVPPHYAVFTVGTERWGWKIPDELGGLAWWQPQVEPGRMDVEGAD